ncbi:hypothetical protein ACGC1H_003036 [Rhizoctonia solani]
MSTILGSALSPIVSCAAPVSRPLASSANSSIQKYSTDRVQLPIILDFYSDGGKQEIREWYRKQPSTCFTHIEHRKETTGRFRHEFIVVHLDNSTVCRFDRRAREDMRGHALKDEGTISEDSAHVITEADTETKARFDESEVLTMKVLDRGQDLDFVLAVCYGIQSHHEAKSYSLLHYNCYFFSWTLLAIIGRRLYQQQSVELESYRIQGRTRAILSGWIENMDIPLPAKSKQAESVWGTGLVRLGRSAMGVNSHQASPVPLIDYYIYRGMKQANIDDIPKMLDRTLPGMLFPSQLSSWLQRELFLALQEGGRLGVRQFFDQVKARSEFSAPVHSGRVNVGGRTFFVMGMDHTYWLSDERARQKAEKTLKTYDEIIDTWIAGLFGMDGLAVFIFYTWPSGIDYNVDGRKTTQEYLTERMVDHFKQVEGYGFGKAERSIERAKDSMSEIWVSVLNMMEDQSELSFL